MKTVAKVCLLQWGRNLPVAEMSKRLRTWANSDDALQWGRNLPVAEIARRGQALPAHGKLQWGRNLPVAEISCHDSTTRPESHASMGPQPSSRGNSDRRLPETRRTRWLQWGRNLPVAEMGRYRITLEEIERALQWGRNLPVAEMAANAGWAAVASEVLQWGRNLPVAEIELTLGALKSTATASMGPQPSSRGNNEMFVGIELIST